MTRTELDITQRYMSRLHNNCDCDFMYNTGMLDGIRGLLEQLGYKPPPLDYLDDPKSKIVKMKHRPDEDAY